MSYKTFRCVVIACLMVCPFYATGEEIGKTGFSNRPQGSNAAYRIAGTQYIEQLEPCNRDYNIATVTLEYLNSFDTTGLGDFLFFNGTPRMRFGNIIDTGSLDEETDIFSRNFFLNDDFHGIASIEPLIQNFITHIDLSFDLQQWCDGLYINVDAPIIWTLWDLQLRETTPTTARIGTTIPEETLGNTTALASPVKSIVQAWKGTTINSNADFFPALKQIMHFATIDGPQTDVRLGTIEFTCGYNVVTGRKSHFDIQGRLVIPTGTKVSADIFFEPIAGNGRHTELGFGITGHDDMWTIGNSTFSMYIDGGIYYLFNAKQQRTFDLKGNGVGSRYLLFKRFNNDGTYAGEVLFGPNVTSLDCKVKCSFMADVAVAAEYNWGDLRVSVGYNIWARSQEKITLTQEIPANTYGIEGNTKTAGPTVDSTASKTRINGKYIDLIDPTPVFLKTDDIDTASAAHPGCASHKLFIFLSNGWLAHPNTPFFGIGLEAEVSALSNSALQQVGLWAKGGITF